MSEFDARQYVQRIFKAKGRDVSTDEDAAEILRIQWTSWKSLFDKHRIPLDPERAERLFQGFVPVQTYGTAQIIEAFGDYLDRQPKKFVEPRPANEPDWKAAASQPEYCSYCNNRGVIDEVPCESSNGRYNGVRFYSFACVCFPSARYAGVKKASAEILEFSRQRYAEQADRLKRWRQANDLDADTFPEFAKKFRVWLKKQGGKSVIFKQIPKSYRPASDESPNKPPRIASKAFPSVGLIDSTPNAQEANLGNFRPGCDESGEFVF